MTLTDRDRKILVVLVPLAALVAFWFLLLSPKRDEVATLDSDLAAAQQELDSARALAASAEQARTEFANDYATVVRLGKAIPATVDMPSLLVQLDSAAEGTKIRFNRVTAGQRTSAPAAGGAAPAAAPDAGGAQSAPGQAAEAAEGAVADANADAAQAGAQTADGPASGGEPQAAGATGSATPPPPGLESVPLDLTFTGRFFDLADFFHDLKRFVYVGGEGDVVVRGRLVTIDSISFSRVGTGANLNVSVKATAFLAPKAEGVTAGATPAGPPPADTQTAGDSGGGDPTTPPAAARIP